MLIERFRPWLDNRVGQRLRRGLRTLKAGVSPASTAPQASVPTLEERLATAEGLLARTLERLTEVNESLARLPAQIAAARDDVARSGLDDTRTLVRLNAVTQNRVADLSAAVQDALRHRQDRLAGTEAIDARTARRDKHVIYFGAPIDPSAEGTAGYLAALRRGLDTLDESVNVWIEHRKGSDPADAYVSLDAALGRLGQPDEPMLPRDCYHRIMRGGTRSIEVYRPSDALAVHHALAQNGRTDILTMLMCHGADPQDPDAARWHLRDVPDDRVETRERMRERDRLAFQRTPIWIFPSRAIYETYLEAIPGLAGDRDGKDVRIEPGRDRGGASGVLLARAYLTSLAAILDAHGHA